MGVENYKNSARYVVLECYCGIWSEEITISYILQAKAKFKEAKTYIESDGGGLVLHRLLMVELAKHNQRAKENYTEGLNNAITCYTPSRQVSKVDKIKAMRPYYNTGYLVFSHTCSNQAQIKKELFSFNPDKPFKQDDTIDALASAINHPEVKPPFISQSNNTYKSQTHTSTKRTWRI